jgi:transcriptional regulator NrdR family protein
MPVKVQKKDGRLEDFDRNKVINGVVKSGATTDQAEEVVRQVEAWLPTAAVNGVVSSMAIRVKVLEVLRVLNPTAAAAFESYRKPAEG